MKRALLAVHVITSVGWLGAVIAFLALAIAWQPTALPILEIDVIVPLCIASFATGLALRRFTHYWVLVKLAITAISTLLLFLHLDVSDRAQLVFDSSAAIAALAIATVLSVYKPRGALATR